MDTRSASDERPRLHDALRSARSGRRQRVARRRHLSAAAAGSLSRRRGLFRLQQGAPDRRRPNRHQRDRKSARLHRPGLRSHHCCAPRYGTLSQGKTGVFFNDRDVDDHERVIAWAAEQPWCDGNVVLFGTSYYGMVQPQVAVRRPPALKAFFSNEMCTDYFRHIVQFGGAPALYFVSLWMGANFTRTQIRLHVPPLIRALASQILNSPLKRLWWPLVQKRMTAIMRGFIKNTPVREVREWYVNWMIDGKTREQNIVPSGPYAELGKIEIPFVTVQNSRLPQPASIRQL